MSLTFTKVKEGVIGDLRYWNGSITLDNSYPTGGYAITASNFLMGSTVYFLHLGQGDVGGILVEWDQVNSKIKCWFPSGGAGAAPTSLIAPAAAAGGTAVTSTAATATLVGGKGVEIGNTANLSTVIIQAFAVGQ